MEFIRTLYDFLRSMEATSQVEMYRKAHPAKILDPVDIITYLREAKIMPKKQENPRINLSPKQWQCFTKKKDTLKGRINRNNHGTKNPVTTREQETELCQKTTYHG
jgi:hypothetical protein